MGVGNCTTRRPNTHGTEVRELLYPWHPWSGQFVHVHEALAKGRLFSVAAFLALLLIGIEASVYCLKRTFAWTRTWRGSTQRAWANATMTPLQPDPLRAMLGMAFFHQAFQETRVSRHKPFDRSKHYTMFRSRCAGGNSGADLVSGPNLTLCCRRTPDRR